MSGLLGTGNAVGLGATTRLRLRLRLLFLGLVAEDGRRPRQGLGLGLGQARVERKGPEPRHAPAISFLDRRCRGRSQVSVHSRHNRNWHGLRRGRLESPRRRVAVKQTARSRRPTPVFGRGRRAVASGRLGLLAATVVTVRLVLVNVFHLPDAVVCTAVLLLSTVLLIVGSLVIAVVFGVRCREARINVLGNDVQLAVLARLDVGEVSLFQRTILVKGAADKVGAIRKLRRDRTTVDLAVLGHFLAHSKTCHIV